jgi:PAS domain-containing protein
MSLATSHPDPAAKHPDEGSARPKAEQSAALQLMLQAPVAMAVWAGAEHVFTLVNEQFCGLVGRSKVELLGKTVRELFPEGGAAGSLMAVLDAVWASAQPRALAEWSPSRTNGAEPSQPVELRLAPAFSGSGAA